MNAHTHHKEDWEKLSIEHQKQYKNFLQRADKNKVLKQLPDLHEEVVAKIDACDGESAR